MPLSSDQRAVLMNEGAFKGVRTLIARGDLSERAGRDVIANTYKAILDEVQEARRELLRLQTTLTALESSARAGLQRPSPVQNDPAYFRMTENLITFDAWVVSLLETDLTITGILAPAHTRNKINELNNALNALMNKRAAEQHPVLDDPKLFAGYVDR